MKQQSLFSILMLAGFMWLAGGLERSPAASDTTPEAPRASAKVSLVALGPICKLNTPSPEPRNWTSSDPSVVGVVEGWVFGRKAGEALVTASRAGMEPLVYSVKVTPGAALRAAPTGPSRVEGFITRKGNELVENGKPFRFISMNVPNLHVIEDASWLQWSKMPKGAEPFYWHRITTAEQEDAVQSVAQMGGQVIRCYTLSVAGGKRNKNGPSHYTGPQAPLNEDLMKDYDRMIAICGQNGVRLILPFIDEWDWFGGRHEFAALSGGGDFYTNRQVIDDFKRLIDKVVNRVNTETGIAYKDDPAIMAWETGNELQHVPAAWTAEIAAWIKNKAPRQLVSDGANGSILSMDDPNVDMLTDHFYGGNDYIGRALDGKARMGAKKPFFIGEFGCTAAEMEIGAMEAALHNGLTGALLWSMRFHSADGGFYWHDEGGENSAYHWPGFPSNARSDETRVLARMRELAWAMRGYLPPPRERPLAPTLLDSSTPSAIAWMGSVGAESYDLERTSNGTDWILIGKDLSDAAEPFQPFNDAIVPAGMAVNYRLKAVNAAGESPWSKILKLNAQ